MDFDTMISTLQLEAYASVLREGHDRTDAMIRNGSLGFPPAGMFEKAYAALGISAHKATPMLACQDEVRRNPAAERLFLILYERLLVSRTAHASHLCGWPSLDALRPGLGDHAYHFYFTILLAGTKILIQQLQTKAHSRAIDPFVVEQTVRDIGSDINGYQKLYGGLPPCSLAFRVFVNFGGEYYRINRLAFHIRTYDGPILVFVHKKSKSLHVCSKPGLRYTESGHRYATSSSESAKGVWTADFYKDDRILRSHRIAPNGTAEPKSTTLNANDWQCVLSRGESVLDIHIPGDEPLDVNLCEEAMRDAVDFFDRAFSDRPAKAFVCTSWLLDERLQHLLDQSSNMVRFQKAFHLYPALLDPHAPVQNVFGYKMDFCRPHNTYNTLERALLDHLRTGRLAQSTAGGCVRIIDRDAVTAS